MSAFLHGAETITFFAPAFMCPLACDFVLNFPEHSKTISILCFFHGHSLGSNLLDKAILSLFMNSVSLLFFTFNLKSPCIESFCNRNALTSADALLLIATTFIFLLNLFS